MKTQLPYPLLPKNNSDKIKWGNLNNLTEISFLLSQAASNDKKVWLVVCPNAENTFDLEQELNFFFKTSKSKIKIAIFPDWETLPYDNFSPHKDIISERLELLYELPQCEHAIIIVSAANVLHRICPADFIYNHFINLNLGDHFTKHQLQQFQQAGYNRVELVEEHGQFAIRGAIVDIFPTGAKTPVRIELFDSKIESLRTFDPETQLTIKKINSFRLLPAHEFPLDDAGVERFITKFKDNFQVNCKKCEIFQDVYNHTASPGVHYYLPLFFEKTATLFDYLPKNSCISLLPQVEQAINEYLTDIKSRFDQMGSNILRPLLPPEQLVLNLNQFYYQINNFSSIRINQANLTSKLGHYNFINNNITDLQANSKLDNPFISLIKWQQPKKNILIVAETEGRQEFIRELLLNNGIKTKIYKSYQDFSNQPSYYGICLGSLDQGINFANQNLAIIPESLIFGKKVTQVRRQKQHATTNAEKVISSLTELNIGDLVIHRDYGIGKYNGLETIDINDEVNEFVVLFYADNQKLYVPIINLQILERYSCLSNDDVKLNSLSSDQWKKARKKAANKALDVATELLEIYSKREIASGYSFTIPDEYNNFADGFPFEETTDQKNAIKELLKNMQSTVPMDRLICGDVGFGKTEVAMRACFIAAYSGTQVAVLVPTTLLAQQHYETFQDRFSGWPIKIGVLSRFNSKKQEQLVKQQLSNGSLDIIIGTHKLLQKNITFKKLGLLVIDEEHRFGVKDKEKIKALKATVDILALTATPIPRSLNMAMSGIRDLSILATPPAKRLSINTFVTEAKDNLIKDAILRELLRGGQVYYLHNEIETIERQAEKIQQLVPNARIDIAHGQMREQQLEQVMYDFYHRKFNLLVCTTIIETGIDVPTANTIIINRADKLGLAQLHQLRGRVGRSHHQAYAYLLRPSIRQISANARKRLDAIASSQELGAGFTLASNDLEIRGAGDLLGKEQSGHIQNIGFSLYSELIHKAVNSLTKGTEFNLDDPLNINIDVNLGIPTLLPDNYVHDVHMRLVLYKRLAQAKTDEQISELAYEVIDRFGKLPEYAANLFSLAKIKLLATNLGVKKLRANFEYALVEFNDKPNINPKTLMTLIQSDVNRLKLVNAHSFRYNHDGSSNKELLAAVKSLLDKLTKD